MGQSWPLFNFRSFHVTIQLQIEQIINVVFEIGTQGHRMVGVDRSTELVWRYEL